MPIHCCQSLLDRGFEGFLLLLVSSVLSFQRVLVAGLREHGFLPNLLELFVKYPFNNILHNIVMRTILSILEGQGEDLLLHLVSECNLPHWLVTAPEEVDSLQGKLIVCV